MTILTLFVALLIFIVVYVLVDFLLKRVPAMAPLAEVLSIVFAALAALLYVGVLK